LGTLLPALSERPEFREAVATGKPLISGALPGTIDLQLQFSVYVPVVDDGAVTHVMAMTFPTLVLSELLAQQNLPESWTAGLVDRTGTIFARHPRADKTVGLKANREILDRLDEQNEAF